jgi:1,4-alpha-glucan branching enzyme
MATTSTPKQAVRKAAKPVTFIVEAADAKEVIVTGDFTQWATDKVRLTRATDGKWRGAVALAPGEYQYRLRVDGEWRDHPEAPKRVPNPFGTENCVLTVS